MRITLKDRIFSRTSLLYQAYALAFFLPLLEAPKNLLILTILCTWIGLKFKERSFSRLPAFQLSIVLLLLAGALLPVAWSEIGVLDAAKDALGWIKYWLVLVIIGPLISARYAFDRFCQFAIAGLGFGIVHSAWEFLQTNAPYPEINSVGHVNQSAMYLVIGLVLCCYRFLFSSSFLERAGVFAVLASGIGLLFPMKSLIAVIALVPALIVCIVFSRKIYANLAIGAAILISIYVSRASGIGSGLINEFQGRVSGSDISSKRIELFNAAWLVACDDHFLGSGIRSFGFSVTPTRIEPLAQQAYGEYIADKYFFSNHGHGLITTVLVERGALGILSFVLLAFAVLWLLIRQGDRAWWCSIGGVGVAVGILSLGNTTFHNEHGALALLILTVPLFWRPERAHS